MFRKLLLVLVLVFASVSAEENRTEPDFNHLPMDYMSLQYAGNIGMISVGIGNLFFDGRYAFELYYGYTPRLVSEVAVSTLAMKHSYVPGSWNMYGHTVEPYAGLGLIYSLNQRYDPNWLDEIPDNYYYQYAFQLIGYVGLSVMHPVTDPASSIKSFGAYMELGTVDSYLINYFSEGNALQLEDVLNTAIGVRMTF